MLNPRYYQEDAFNNFIDYSSDHPEHNPLIVLPTGCLIGDTDVEVNIDGRAEHMSMLVLYELYDNHVLLYRKRPVWFIKAQKENGDIDWEPIIGVVCSGVKPVYRITTADGYTVTGTKCHKIKTTVGWVRIGRLSPEHKILCVSGGNIFESSFSSCVSLKDQYTYDIQCLKNHNFVANGIVVHNSGKSFINAMIIQDVISFPKTRVLCLTHQKDLIQQNLEEYLGVVGQEQAFTVGVYSAGLKSRDTDHRIIFAGIQSVHKRAYELGRFDLIIIDEVHRVPVKSEGTYRRFLDDMKKINKRCMIVGLSATPYRLKGGLLCDESHKERIFHEICHETTMTELMDAHHKKNRDKKQYLCPLISKNSVNRADMSGVSKAGGEYNAHEMEEAFNKSDLVACAVREIKELAWDRKRILVFTTGIKHCEAVTQALIDVGFTAGCVHSQKLDMENDQVKNDFRTGKIQCLVNVDCLTVGYNQKNIDCIAMLRSTLSPGLYVQIAGRGTRLHEDKENCLFLDFGGNILRHGPVDKIEIQRGGGKKSNGKVGTIPMKECPQCHAAIHLSVKICPECGYQYPEEEAKHDKEASNESILSGYKAPITVDVKFVSYSAHEKPGKTKSLRVDYYYNEIRGYYSEWVCLDHDGFAQKKAFQWVKTRLKDGITVSACPSVDQMLERTEVLNEPKQIMVDFNGKFPRITGYIF